MNTFFTILRYAAPWGAFGLAYLLVCTFTGPRDPAYTEREVIALIYFSMALTMTITALQRDLKTRRK